MLEQKELLFREVREDVSNDVLTKIPTWKEALRLTKEISGLTDLQICQELGIDPAQWSRIWQGKANFPDDKFIPYIYICQNLIPLRWLALNFGFEIKSLKNILEKENEALRAELDREKLKREAIHEFLKDKGLKL